jgi:hypothetical protein
VDGGSWIVDVESKKKLDLHRGWDFSVPVRPWNILFQVLHAGAIQFIREIEW